MNTVTRKIKILKKAVLLHRQARVNVTDTWYSTEVHQADHIEVIAQAQKTMGTATTYSGSPSSRYQNTDDDDDDDGQSVMYVYIFVLQLVMNL